MLAWPAPTLESYASNRSQQGRVTVWPGPSSPAPDRRIADASSQPRPQRPRAALHCGGAGCTRAAQDGVTSDGLHTSGGGTRAPPLRAGATPC
eukprot:scaffold8166_cov376-Prasinococcus_capsulatus_cf.AAC.7